MKMKKWFVLFLVAVMALSAVGCSTPESTPSQSADTSESAAAPASEEAGDQPVEEVTLTMLVDSNRSLDGIQAVCDLAKEKLGITVEIEIYPGGEEGDNLIKTRLASGEESDIISYNSGSLLAALNPTEYFIDLTNEPCAAKLDDAFKKAVTIDGKVYGVPVCSSQAGAIIYNKELYAKYNLQVPKTWDEFISNCETLKAAGETALLGAFGDSWTAQVLYLGDHYNVMAAEPNFAADFTAGTAKYATTPAAFRSFEKLEQTKPYYNADALATTYADACDKIVNGEGAHWVMLTQSLSNVYSLYGDDVNKLGVFGVPGDDANNSGLTVWMPGGLYGSKNSDKGDAIKRFLEFYISDEALDAYTAVVLPDGPYCVKGYQLPDGVYAGVKDEQAYFDAGKIVSALEFESPVKGPNCPAICQAAASGQMNAKEAAETYDADCLKQAIQLGLGWK